MTPPSSRTAGGKPLGEGQGWREVALAVPLGVCGKALLHNAYAMTCVCKGCRSAKQGHGTA